MSREPTYQNYALPLLNNGYLPLPIRPHTRRPAVGAWTQTDFSDYSLVNKLIGQYGNCGVGIVMGATVGIDIDCNDEMIAKEVQALCIEKLGPSPSRIGQSPKVMLFYRNAGEPVPKRTTPEVLKDGQKQQVEFLGKGNQAVVFGRHPGTKQPYIWPSEDLTQVAFDKLPAVTELQLIQLDAQITALLQNTASFQELAVTTPPNDAVQADPRFPISVPLKFGQLEEVREALQYLDPEHREEWIAIGHALKAAFPEAEGEALFQEWSKRRPNGSTPSSYKGPRDVENTFKSLNPTRTGIDAIYTRASTQGWQRVKRLPSSNISHTSIAKALKAHLSSDRRTPIFAEGDLWTFEATHWVAMPQQDQRALIQDLDGTLIGNKKIISNKSFIDGSIFEFHSVCAQPDFFSRRACGINCQSGFIAISDDGEATLEPHNPAHGQRHTLDARWAPGPAPEASGLLKTLFEGCFGHDWKAYTLETLILQIIGIACSGMSNLLVEPKAFILYGPSAANGKSQILELIRGFLPDEAVASIPPADFKREQYLALLRGKMANLSDELSSYKAIASEKMKQVITGDVVTAKAVYKEPFSFKNSVVNVFASNTLPGFQGGVDNGVMRRLAVIPFDRVIPRENRVPEIGARAAREQSDLLLSLVVFELQKLIARKCYDIPPFVETATKQWFHDADLVLMWLEDGGLEGCLKHGEKRLSSLYKSFRYDVEDLTNLGSMPSQRRFIAQVTSFLFEHPTLEIHRRSEGRVVRKKTAF